MRSWSNHTLLILREALRYLMVLLVALLSSFSMSADAMYPLLTGMDIP